MLTLGDLIREGLTPMITCRRCGRTVQGGVRALASQHGANTGFRSWANRLRCGKCGCPPDVALIWDDGGAAARANDHRAVGHVSWRLVRNDGSPVGG